jgi:hypothetical protein
VFPGNWINKRKLVARDEETKNSICMSDASSLQRRTAMEDEEEDGKRGRVDTNRKGVDR